MPDEAQRERRHVRCGGIIVLDGDTYCCQRCNLGWKCIGAEHFLDDVTAEPVPSGEKEGV